MTDAPAAVIRPIAGGDRDAWARLFVDYGVFYETTFTESIVDGVWGWLTDAEHTTNAYVADVDGTVVGFAIFRSVADTFTAGTAWFLDDLYVDPSARGSGAATALIQGLTDHAAANGGGTIRWITAEDNERAQRVYNRVATRTTWVTYEREAN